MNISRGTPPAQPRWILTDHVCRHCGGRILQCATGCGPTPGGNPVFQCADCGIEAGGAEPKLLSDLEPAFRALNRLAHPKE